MTKRYKWKKKRQQEEYYKKNKKINPKNTNEDKEERN